MSRATTTVPPPPVVQGHDLLSTGIGCTWAGAMWRPVAFWTQLASSRETAVTTRARANTGRASRRASRELRSSAASVPCTVTTSGALDGAAMPGGHPPVRVHQVGPGGDLLAGGPPEGPPQARERAPSARTAERRRHGAAVGESLLSGGCVAHAPDPHTGKLFLPASTLVARCHDPHFDAAAHERRGERAEE